MSPIRRWSFAVAAAAAITGGGIGNQAGGAGFGLAPGLGAWIALLAFGTLVALFLSVPVRADHPLAASGEAGWTEFRRELRRARRGGRPLTVLRIAGDELPPDGPDGPATLGTRSRRLALHLRLVDRTWVDDGSIYVLLPESPRAAANALIGRIRAVTPGQLPERVRIATFPDNGLTSGALVAALHDGVVDAVPIPIHPLSAESGENAFVPDEEYPIGEVAHP